MAVILRITFAVILLTDTQTNTQANSNDCITSAVGGVIMVFCHAAVAKRINLAQPSDNM